MRRHFPSISCAFILLSACGAPEDSRLTGDAAVPVVPLPAPAPLRPAPVPRAAFAPPPAVGWIARATCHMGVCTWNRYEQVERSGGDAAPRYRLKLIQGESRHAGDYPSTADGAQIAWDASAKGSDVHCSYGAPYASMDVFSGQLPLNPNGVPGAAQALANLYFATCHGEYGNDAELARKYGYGSP